MLKQAIIPAAGRGLRLDRPGTPKPLVDVFGTPLIVRLIRQLGAQGVDEVVVVTGYEAQRIEQGVKAHRKLGAAVSFVECPGWERGLAASLLAARDHVDDRFVIAMADHVFDDELVALVCEQEVSPGRVFGLVDPRLDGIYDIESATRVDVESGLVRRIGRGLSPFNAVDAGLFAADRGLFDHVEAVVGGAEPTDRELSFALERVAAEGALHAVYARAGEWDDVDTPSALIHAELRLRNRLRRAAVGPADTARPKLEGTRHVFDVHNGKQTEIVVGRGFVRRPRGNALIPPEASSSPSFVFTDETVAGIYAHEFAEELTAQGYDIQLIVLPDGEESKSLASYSYLVERVLSRGVDERSVFISLGGGVVCNVCGFVASTIYRGLDLVHLPTTLMAQCDAAISHKQAINGQRGKNLIGAYYNPRLVAVDVETLSTLDHRLIVDGMSEVVKHAIGQDEVYVDLLRDYDGPVDDTGFLERVIRRNVELKCELATVDAIEKKEAMILQYGHAVGHAVEHLSGYRLYHGESVSIGMVVVARIARILGAASDDLVDLHLTLLEQFGLPVHIPRDIHTQDLIAALRHDKLYLVEGTRMPLLSGVGRLWRVDGEYAIPISDRVMAEAIELSKEPEE